MFSPVRSVAAAVPGAAPAVLAASVATTAVFSATPFLIPEVAARFAVSDGSAGLLSVVQVAVFAAANLLLPRLLGPSTAVFRRAAIGLVAANLVTLVAPSFVLLLLARGLAGLAAGALTWLAWAAAMGSERGVRTMSSVGPVAALVAAPAMAVLAEAGGDRWIWATLALVAVPGVVLPAGTFARTGRPADRSGSRSNRVLLAALCVLTMAGASLFVFQRVLAVDELGMTPFAASLGFSLNAAAGLVGARLAHRHRRPGLWLASAGPAAWLSVAGGAPVWFFLGMAWWGLAFWMGVPGVLRMLAARSLRPDERAGDAQGLMAMGRSVGPGVGGGFIDGGDPAGLAAFTGLGMALAGLTVVGVQEGRDALPVSDARTAPG